MERVRLDATTSCGYHTVTDDGLMQLGHSKDHRPDLAQFKLMAAAAEPSGLFLAGDVHPGNAADDPLYLPLIAGSAPCWVGPGCSTPATARWPPWRPGPRSRARGDFYLTRLPLTGAVPAQFAAWVEAAVGGAAAAELVEIRIGEEPIGTGYEFERHQTAVVDGSRTHLDGAGAGHPLRVAGGEPGARPGPSAGEGRGGGAGLTPPPGPGRAQFTTGWELERAVAAVLAEHEVVGLLEVAWAREETSRTQYVGPGRGGPDRPKTTEWTIRYQITTVRRDEAAIQERVARMGWQVQVTNVAARAAVAGGSVLAYRGGWTAWSGSSTC